MGLVDSYAETLNLFCLLPVGQNGFVVQQKRWVVERTFAWFSRFWRLTRESELLNDVRRFAPHIIILPKIKVLILILCRQFLTSH